MEGFILLLLCFSLLHNMAFSTARDTMNTEQLLNDGETIVSAGESFALGFFSPSNSNNRYLGIWYNKGPLMTVVWVANRDQPLKDSSGVLRINDTGTLVLLNHNNSVLWSSSNSQKMAQNPVAKLLESGNLIVKDGSNNDPKYFLWQSFDYPSDTLLPGMKLGRDLITGMDRYLTSWDTPNDPSKGEYTYQLDMNGYPQFIVRKGNVKIFRFGSWNGLRFSGAPQMKPNSLYTFSFVSNDKEIYYEFELVNVSVLSRMVLSTDGKLQRYSWNSPKDGWTVFATIPGTPCDNYAQCGANAGCNSNNFPTCSCLEGFVPKRPKEWNEGDWSDGCVRRTPLSCHGDGFLKFSRLKLPDTERSWFNSTMSLKDCGNLCLNNCSCSAYAGLNISEGTTGCLMWFGDLNDIMESSEPQQDIYIRMAQTELDASEGKKLKHDPSIRKKAAIVISSVLSVGVLIVCLVFLWKKHQEDRKKRCNSERDAGAIYEYPKEDLELPFFDIATLTSATNSFSTRNILGEGGFGSVYKGRLEDGREIAVKRLSETSRQGLQEFKNEVIHIAKLQHRNLVRLLGCCIHAEERMLVYEFMPNKSLDFFIFDNERCKLLDWPKRIRIINGIARGLLYLHQDSRHRIVHRDLKAANVLLDAELNPKISDFGLARSFGGDENEAKTKHVVGTYGYVSPEYIIDGLFSTKSDVFSFGVLVLEIVSGKRNKGFSHKDHHFNLLGHTWRLFREGRCLEIADATILETFSMSEMLRSIHVGLLCVQRSPEERPSMLSVVTMLSSESSLPQPKMPGFFTERDFVGDSSSSSCCKSSSINDLTISQIDAR